MNELFRREALLIDDEPRSWQEAIRVSGGLLLEAGSIEEPYIQGMIDAVEELGPYMVIAPHIAIAHAAAGTNVLKNDMVLVVFREPVNFGCENDPVHLMIGMCALEPGSHLEQFRALANILVDDTVWEKLRDCRDLDALYELVNQ